MAVSVSVVSRAPERGAPRLAAMALHPAIGTGVDLVDIAAGLAVTARDIPLDDGDATRQYRMVFSTQRYDAWVIRWRAAAELALHDHGGSSGVVHVVDGELVEYRVELGSPRRPRARTVRPSGTIRIDADTIHGVVNLAAPEALSVHVYSPRLSRMTFYDEHDGVLTVQSTSVVDAGDGPA